MAIQQKFVYHWPVTKSCAWQVLRTRLQQRLDASRAKQYAGAWRALQVPLSLLCMSASMCHQSWRSSLAELRWMTSSHVLLAFTLDLSVSIADCTSATGLYHVEV